MTTCRLVNFCSRFQATYHFTLDSEDGASKILRNLCKYLATERCNIPGRLECSFRSSLGTKLCVSVFENPASDSSFLLPRHVPESGIRT